MTRRISNAAGREESTIRDVARVAGVSVASVSRVINGVGNVRDETRQRILAAVESLRYVPHSGARSLITHRTNLVGVLLPDLYGEFFSEIIRGIDAAARERKLQILVSSAHGDVAEIAAASRAMCGLVDGLLVMSPHVDARFLDDNLPARLPIVLMNTPIADPRYSTFTIEGYKGSCAMIRHLVGLGHARIAHIAGPDDNFDSQERLRGYRDELARQVPGAAPMVVQGDFSEKSGYLAGLELARRFTGPGDRRDAPAFLPSGASRRPDAVFAANDMMAVGCLAALGEAGLAVPGDIGVAGFDDIPLAGFVRPALTTVRVRMAELGRAALEELARRIEKPGGTRRRVRSFSPELVVRESCGAARSAAATPMGPPDGWPARSS